MNQQKIFLVVALLFLSGMSMSQYDKPLFLAAGVTSLIVAFYFLLNNNEEEKPEKEDEKKVNVVNVYDTTPQIPFYYPIRSLYNPFHRFRRPRYFRRH